MSLPEAAAERCAECGDGRGWYAQQTGDHEQEQIQCRTCFERNLPVPAPAVGEGATLMDLPFHEREAAAREFFIEDMRKHPGDWPEDFRHENGIYSRRCGNCGSDFTGHKRRTICKECSSAPEKPAPAPAVGEGATASDSPTYVERTCKETLALVREIFLTKVRQLMDALAEVAKLREEITEARIALLTEGVARNAAEARAERLAAAKADVHRAELYAVPSPRCVFMLGALPCHIRRDRHADYERHHAFVTPPDAALRSELAAAKAENDQRIAEGAVVAAHLRAGVTRAEAAEARAEKAEKERRTLLNNIEGEPALFAKTLASLEADLATLRRALELACRDVWSNGDAVVEKYIAAAKAESKPGPRK